MTPDPPADQASLGRDPVLLIALGWTVVSLVLRSQHLDWGLPDLEEEAFPLRKAFEMWAWGTGETRLDPETAGWPSLSFYVHMAVQGVHYLFGRTTGAFTDRGDYFLQQLTWTPLAVWARWVGVIAGSATVFIGARLGGRLAGRGGALLAGAVLAASPLLTTHAQLITPDILLTLFAALALARIVRIHDRGALRDYVWAGVWIGLGASTKYTPVLMVPALYVSHLLRLRTAGIPLTRLGLDRRAFWFAGLAALLSFLVTSPYLLTDLGVLTRDLDYQVAHMQEGHFGHEMHGFGPLYYARDVLGPGLGWLAFLAGLSGLVWAAVRRGGTWWPVLVAFLGFFVGMSLLSTRFDRYMLPALVPLALGAAGWWGFAGELMHRRSNRSAFAVAAAVAVVLAAGPFVDSLAFLGRQGRSGTLQQAREWILQHRRAGGPYLAMELYTPSLPRVKQIRLRRGDPAFEYLNPEQRARWLDLDPVRVVYLPFYTTREGASDFYYDLRHFLAYDFVVTSSQVRGRYEGDPERWPRQSAFYAALDRHVEGVTVFAPGDDRRGPEIRIYGMTAETRARLAEALGPIQQADFRSAAGRVVGSHFQDFVRSIADHAVERGDFARAATYYQPLYESLPPERRDAFLPAYATALVRTARWDRALPLLDRWRRSAPRDPLPAGYRGLVLAETGRVEEARNAFGTCLELAGNDPAHAELAAWVRLRLTELESSSR